MLNVLTLLGRLSKDPELKQTGETTIVNFDLAVDNVRKEKDGTRGTSFFKVVCINGVAENVSKHLHKGSKVVINGYIQQRNYLAKDGSKRSVYEITADTVEFLDPKPVEEEPAEPNLDEIPVEELGNEVTAEEEKEEPKFDPYTGKPLKDSKKK